MAFKGVNGKNIVCIRSLQLTQKANNKQEVKTLEGALKSLNEEGEVITMCTSSVLLCFIKMLTPLL